MEARVTEDREGEETLADILMEEVIELREEVSRLRSKLSE